MSLSLKGLWSKVSMRREKRKGDRAQNPRGWGCKMQEEASETIDMWPFNLTTNSIQFWEYIVMIKIMDWKLVSYIDGYIILKNPFRGKFLLKLKNVHWSKILFYCFWTVLFYIVYCIVDWKYYVSFRCAAEWFRDRYMYLFFFKFFSHLGCYILLSRVPCAVK